MSAESRNIGIGVFLMSIAVVCLASSGLCRAEADDDRYLNAVREFADKVLECGRDVYGPKHTPLFVDGVDADTLEPVKWKYQGQEWIMSNLATQQNLFRVFDGLTRLTGDPKYHDAAVAAIRYAFANLVDDNGLLCWGGHAMYDAGGDRLVGEGPKHELKHHYPYYELMWEVDPAATKRFIEAFWNAHILNWSNLDMNRHGKYHSTEGKFKFWNSGYKGGEMGKLWGNEYEGGPIFFVGKGLTFDATGTDLMYAAALLHKFSWEKEPLIWAKRLAYRYVEARDPKTGLGGVQYSSTNASSMYFALEMYRITDDSQFLALARKVGDNILERRFRDGFFFPYGKNYQFAKFDTRVVPALLHLVATGRGHPTIMPEAWPSRRGAFFQCPYADKGRQVSSMIYRAKRQGGLIFE